jgi:hypothetical protein
VQLEKLYWRDVKSDIFKVNQELAEIIDKLNPPDDCFFYKAVYPYGDEVLLNGEFRLPAFNGKKYALADQEVPDEVKKEIGYNPGTHPALIIMNHVAELFLNINSIAVPNMLVFPGDLLGVSYVMKEPPFEDPQLEVEGKSVWEMTSGARSTFFLPKICDGLSHKRLEKELGIINKKPDEIFDHWSIFKAISSKLGSNWDTTILFFSRKWFIYAHTPEWAPFRLYLYRAYVHKFKNYWNNLMGINMGLTEIHFQQNLKPTPIVIDIIRNIFATAAADSLGFQPAIDDSMLPASVIQDAYINIYKLRDYYPTIMQPAYYGVLNKNPIYTSVNMMSIENLYDALKAHTDAKLIEEVRYIYRIYAEVLKSGKVNVDALYLSEVAKNKEVEFYHYLRHQGTSLRDTKEIPLQDKNFITSKYPKNQEFAHAGTFIKACIRISPK